MVFFTNVRFLHDGAPFYTKPTAVYYMWRMPENHVRDATVCVILKAVRDKSLLDV